MEKEVKKKSLGKILFIAFFAAGQSQIIMAIVLYERVSFLSEFFIVVAALILISLGAWFNNKYK